MHIVSPTFRPFYLLFPPSLPQHFLLRLSSSTKCLLATRFSSLFHFFSVICFSLTYFKKCLLPTRLSVPFASLFHLLFRYTSCSVYFLLINTYCLPAFPALFRFLFRYLFTKNTLINAYYLTAFPALFPPFSAFSVYFPSSAFHIYVLL
jgi:hypothetical protein